VSQSYAVDPRRLSYEKSGLSMPVEPRPNVVVGMTPSVFGREPRQRVADRLSGCASCRWIQLKPPVARLIPYANSLTRFDVDT
jgi:hypothetical protein